MFVTAAHIVPTTTAAGGGEPSAGLQPPPQRFRLHEESEGALTVDLHDGDRRAVGGLELGIATDVDTFEVTRTHLVDHLEHAFAEVATVGVVHDDSRDRAPA